MQRVITGLTFLVLGAGFRADAQPPGPRPGGTKPTVFVGPASLSASSNISAQVGLSWPALAGADRYRITRIENAGDSEAMIAEFAASAFALGRSSCAVSGGYSPNCVFLDVTKVAARVVGGVPDPSTLSTPLGTIYPHEVRSGKVYTYRVWGIFVNGVVSPPSPPATVTVK